MINTHLRNKDQQKKSQNTEINTSEKVKILGNKFTNPRKGVNRFSILPAEIKRRTDISPGAKQVYAELINYAGKKDNAFPKRSTISEACGIHIRRVDKHIKELKDKGLVFVERRGLRRSNKYFFIEQDWQQTTPVCLHSTEDENKHPITEENSGVEYTPECTKQVTPIGKDNYNKIHIAGETIPKRPSKAMQHDIAKKMMEVWVNIVEEGGVVIELGDKLIGYLKQALKDRFGGCIEKWKAYCERIASSKYLMGEKEIKGVWSKKWRANLDWCLKFANIDKVLSGNLYGFGDRVKKQTVAEVKQEEQNTINQIKELPEPESIRKVRLNIATRIGIPAYKSWIRNAIFEEKEGGWLDIKLKYDWNARRIEDSYGISILKSIEGVYGRVSICGNEIIDWEAERKKRALPRSQEHDEIDKTGVRDAISSFFSLCTSQGVSDAIKT